MMIRNEEKNIEGTYFSSCTSIRKEKKMSLTSKRKEI